MHASILLTFGTESTEESIQSILQDNSDSPTLSITISFSGLSGSTISFSFSLFSVQTCAVHRVLDIYY